jgi:hypothetical protein
MQFTDIKTWIITTDHKARPCNPFDYDSSVEYTAYERFATSSKDHVYHTDESLQPGEYPAGIFHTPSWQVKLSNGWNTITEKHALALKEYNKTGIDKPVELRQFLRLRSLTNEEYANQFKPTEPEKELPPIVVPKGYWNCGGCEMDYDAGSLGDDSKCPVCGITCDMVLVEDHPTMIEPDELTGAELILNKRGKHLSKYGYNADHDNGHTPMQFINAAKAYMYRDPYSWPFDKESFKLDDDTENLANAGSMLAAAIDLIKAKSKHQEP